MNNIITKKCPKCEKDLDLSNYYIRKNGNPQDCCKKCYNLRGSKYQKREKDAVNERARKRHRKSPERYNRQSRDWYKAHPGIKTIVNQNYYMNNKDKMRMLVTAWENKHPENIRAKGHNYRARKLSVGGEISGEEWNNLLIKYGNRCLCCGRSDVRLELDHVIPLSKGGKNVIENAQPLCRSCNAKKNVKIIDYRRDFYERNVFNS